MKPDFSQLKNVTRSRDISAVLTHSVDWKETRENILHLLPDKPFVAPRVLSALVRMLEGVLVAIVALANLIRYPGLDSMNEPWLYFTVTLVAAIVFPALLNLSGSYRLNTLLNPLPRLTSIAACWLLMLGGITLFAFVGKVGADLSRGWLLSWALSGFFFAFAFRFALAHFVRRLNRNGQLNRRAVLVGGGAAADANFGRDI